MTANMRAEKNGMVHRENFRDIWLGDRRKKSLEFVSGELDPQGCRMNCRMDEINMYLWDLTHPQAHVNFI